MNKFPNDSILQGDCLELLRSIPENSIDLIFADPPYNLQLTKELHRPDNSLVSAVNEAWDKFLSFQEYDQFTKQWLTGCRRALKKTGSIWVIGTYHNIFRIGSIMQDLDFWILNDIIWVKTNPMPNFRGVRFTNSHETIIWAQKSKKHKAAFNNQSMRSLNDDLQMRSEWHLTSCVGRERLRVNGKKVHPTQKPEALIYRILMACSKPGDVILDPFFGTGTTGVVARKLGRNFLGIEKDGSYLEAARERIRTTTAYPLSSIEYPELNRSHRIPFGTFIEAGLISPGQTLYSSENEAITASVLANGQIKCGELIGSIHGVAKEIHNGVPCNGWDFWMFETGGKKVSIDTLRKNLFTGNKNDK